jgi:hypothetical protein
LVVHELLSMYISMKSAITTRAMTISTGL